MTNNSEPANFETAIAVGYEIFQIQNTFQLTSVVSAPQDVIPLCKRGSGGFIFKTTYTLISIKQSLLTMPIPTLSIIMPVFNAETYIRESLESLLHQTFTDFELIIIDDGCTDNSMEIIREMMEPRIRVLTNDANRGIVYSRNRGIENVKGRYIAPFDSDDIARHDKFEKQIAFLEKNRDYGMIGSWCVLIDDHGKPTGKKWKVNEPPERIPAILLFRNYFAQSAMVIRKELIPEGGYSTGYDVVEDYKMWIDITSRHKAWNYPDYLLYYRVHSKSITNREEQKMSARDVMIFNYLYKKLQIEPDEKMLSMLIALKNGHVFENAQSLKELQAFLLLIIDRNRKTGLYDEKELIRVVHNRYLKACATAIRFRFSNIGACISSELHRLALQSFLWFGRRG
jgi:glycosyltransferase involved in cell wall biosynthesis